MEQSRTAFDLSTPADKQYRTGGSIPHRVWEQETLARVRSDQNRPGWDYSSALHMVAGTVAPNQHMFTRIKELIRLDNRELYMLCTGQERPASRGSAGYEDQQGNWVPPVLPSPALPMYWDAPLVLISLLVGFAETPASWSVKASKLRITTETPRVFTEQFCFMHAQAGTHAYSKLFDMLVTALRIGEPGREPYTAAYETYAQTVRLDDRTPEDLADRMEIVYDNLIAAEETVRTAAQALSMSGMSDMAKQVLQRFNRKDRALSGAGASGGGDSGTIVPYKAPAASRRNPSSGPRHGGDNGASRAPSADCFMHPGIGHTNSECNRQAGRSGPLPTASGSSHNHRGRVSSVTEATRSRQLEAEQRTAQASLRQYQQRSERTPAASNSTGQQRPNAGGSSHQHGGYGYQQRAQWPQPPQQTQWQDQRQQPWQGHQRQDPPRDMRQQGPPADGRGSGRQGPPAGRGGRANHVASQQDVRYAAEEMSAEGAVYDENAYVMTLTACDSEDEDGYPNLVSSRSMSDDEPPRITHRVNDGSMLSLRSWSPRSPSDYSGSSGIPSLVASSTSGSTDWDLPDLVAAHSNNGVPNLCGDTPSSLSDEPEELDWHDLPVVLVPQNLVLHNDVSHGVSYLGRPYHYTRMAYADDEADMAVCCTVLQMPASYTRTGSPEASLFADADMLARAAASAQEAGRTPPVPATNPFSEAPEATPIVIPTPAGVPAATATTPVPPVPIVVPAPVAPGPVRTAVPGFPFRPPLRRGVIPAGIPAPPLASPLPGMRSGFLNPRPNLATPVEPMPPPAPPVSPSPAPPAAPPILALTPPPVPVPLPSPRTRSHHHAAGHPSLALTLEDGQGLMDIMAADIRLADIQAVLTGRPAQHVLCTDDVTYSAAGNTSQVSLRDMWADSRCWSQHHKRV